MLPGQPWGCWHVTPRGSVAEHGGKNLQGQGEGLCQALGQEGTRSLGLGSGCVTARGGRTARAAGGGSREMLRGAGRTPQCGCRAGVHLGRPPAEVSLATFPSICQFPRQLESN